MIQLAVLGATGRTGQCVLELASRDKSFEIAAALTGPRDPLCGSTLHVGGAEVSVVDKLDTSCDVMVDFSVAAGTVEWLSVCERLRMPMVIGTTGHDDRQLARIHEAARGLPIVKAVNFSLGVQALIALAGRLAKELGQDYDIELVEAHHRGKVDAPSGTALAILDEILNATERSRDRDVVFGRQGQTGKRPQGQIGVHALRMGELVGRHEIHFSGPGETITVQHMVHSRATFAAGALRAAAWIIDKKPGLYSLSDVVGAAAATP